MADTISVRTKSEERFLNYMSHHDFITNLNEVLLKQSKLPARKRYLIMQKGLILEKKGIITIHQ